MRMATQSFSLLAVCFLFLASVSTSAAQDLTFPGDPLQDPIGGGLDFGVPSEGELKLSASFQLEEGKRVGKLTVQGEISPEWHVYALTQPPGGPLRSELKLVDETVVKLTGKFVAETAPHIIPNDPIFGIRIEEHGDHVVWSVPVEIGPNVKPESATFTVIYNGQICNDQAGCIPLDGLKVEASFAGYSSDIKYPQQPGSKVIPFKIAHVTMSGWIEPLELKSGGSGTLVIKATPDEHFHVYQNLANMGEGLSYAPTLIAITEAHGVKFGKPETTSEVKNLLIDEKPSGVMYHEGEVLWKVPIEIPQSLVQGQLLIEGKLGIQTCNDVGCDPPAGASFSFVIDIKEESQPGQQQLVFSKGTYDDASYAASQQSPSTDEAVAVSQTAESDPQVEGSDLSFAMVIVWALIGGFILNFMPCVLPVIGLKVMSFVDQSGESRVKIFALNIWYTLGILAVFMFLATTVAVFNLGWGELFTYDSFKLILVSVLFVMALSFLGVWEIPIPGFVGGSSANKLEQKEGATGAFFKGIIATLLATPCSGPGLAVAIAWCTDKPPVYVYCVFVALGIGMSFPFILIGINPGLIRFLPKPGAWMETFKQSMGFVLMGAVVFFLTILNLALVVPTVAFMFGLWAACWWYNRTPVTADLSAKIRCWAGAVAIAGLVWALAYAPKIGVGYYSIPGLHQMSQDKLTSVIDREVDKAGLENLGDGLNREEMVLKQIETLIAKDKMVLFNNERLGVLQAQKKTVLVDFTADWCLTCKTLEKLVLHTETIQKRLHENGVITMVADWTEKEKAVEVTGWLNKFGSKQIPLYAIFPADDPSKPIVLMAGDIGINNLLEKLEEAGPSLEAPPASEATATTIASLE